MRSRMRPAGGRGRGACAGIAAALAIAGPALAGCSSGSESPAAATAPPSLAAVPGSTEPGADAARSRADPGTAGAAPGASAPQTAPAPHPQVVEPVAGDRSSPAPARRRRPRPPATVSVDPAVVTGPAPKPPSDAEIRRALARLRSAESRYHFDSGDFADDLLAPGSLPRGGWRQSIASVYTDYGLPIACGGVLHPDQLGVAHKTLPCGTMITFRYGGRAIRIPVIDRGPYISGREWDFTGAAAAALGFPGLGVVTWREG